MAAVAKAGYPVFPVPGASALLSGLVAAGVPVSPFWFEGFLQSKTGDRRRRLRDLVTMPGLIVFYEAPHRLIETLADALDILGDRPAVVARELTKRFETFQRGSLATLHAHYATIEAPRGEIVLMIGTSERTVDPADIEAAIDARLLEALKTMSLKDAAQTVAAALGLPKRQVYAKGLMLQNADALQSAPAQQAAKIDPQAEPQ